MAEAYIHFSVEDTFGKVIAEAMSCGTIPITFNSTACGEISGPYGFVVKPHDIEAILCSLTELPNKKNEVHNMIEFVRSNYDYTSNASQYLKQYKRLLSE